MLLLAGIVLFLSAFVSSVHATGMTIGGYDVERIAAATVARLSAAGIVTPADWIEAIRPQASESGDPLVQGAAIVRFYDRIGALLVEQKIASVQEIETVRKAAAASGGVKVGGVNPMVLAASFLDLLVRKGILPLPEAQSILDSARRQ